ncbi:MAG: hypothetical protein ACNI27_11200 [Desulfovibrio sp.]
MLFLFPEGTQFTTGKELDKAFIAPAQQFLLNNVTRTGRELLLNPAAETESEWIARINALGIYPVDQSRRPYPANYHAGAPQLDVIVDGWARAIYPDAKKIEAPTAPEPSAPVKMNLSKENAERMQAAKTMPPEEAVPELIGILESVFAEQGAAEA